jgi:hypothetical protein
MELHPTAERTSEGGVLEPRSAPAPARRGRGLELTPAEHQAVRRNRRWMLAFFVPSVALLVLALIASAVAESNQPRGPKAVAPPGYKAVRDSYYSYAVPAGWSTNGIYTDQTGDVDTSGPSGWAGEHIGYRAAPPVLGEAPPVSVEAFGVAQPAPYTIAGGHAVRVPGAAAAFEYTFSRADGFRAVAVDVWSARTGVELWLVVHAPAGETGVILSSLTA